MTTETKSSCGNANCQCEKECEYSLLSIKIANPSRLCADLTEDFFLIPNDQFDKAVSALYDESLNGSNLLYAVEDIKDILDHYEVKYDHVTNGHRFVFNIMESNECDCNGE